MVRFNPCPQNLMGPAFNLEPIEPRLLLSGSPALEDGRFNNLRSQATEVQAQAGGVNAVAEGDDWFQVQLGAGDLRVTIEEQIPGVALGLELKDRFGNNVAGAYQPSSVKTLEASNLAAGSYYLYVFAAGGGYGSGTGGYSLRWSGAAVDAVAGGNAAAGTNDVRARAADTAVAAGGLQATAESDDWYTLNLAGGDLRLSLNESIGDVALGLELKDAAGNNIAGAYRADGRQALQANNLAGGTYYVYVFAAGGYYGNRAGIYNLGWSGSATQNVASFNDRSPDQAPGSGASGAVANTTRQTAEALPSGQTRLNATADSDNWYRVQLAGGSVRVSLDGSQNGVTLGLELKDAFGNNIAGAYSGAASKSLTANDLAGGTYYLYVYAAGGNYGSGNSGYTLTLDPGATPASGPSPTPSPAVGGLNTGRDGIFRVSYIGHSLLDHTWNLVEALAEANGVSNYEDSHQFIAGAPLSLSWTGGNFPGNTRDPRVAKGTLQRDLIGSREYDVLILTPGVNIESNLQYNAYLQNAKNFVREAIRQNPDVEVLLYQHWPQWTNRGGDLALNNPNASSKDTYREQVAYEELLLEYVADELDTYISGIAPNRSSGAADTRVVPVAQTVLELDRRLDNGTFNARGERVNGEPLQRITDFFIGGSDVIHFEDPWYYLTAATVHATLFGRAAPGTGPTEIAEYQPGTPIDSIRISQSLSDQITNLAADVVDDKRARAARGFDFTGIPGSVKDLLRSTDRVR